ncbi:hypothetical protein HS088_TW12G00254 [Tripterygium wilfordii]|uniref:Mediator complex subunit 15 KIX domain-containing protein n=1 Tax=Tripterygium wilfordii TaxID=458696 RepID=A0A7J7CZ09_TRIWF|nr:hypothetical protein HS088_TW12G00254 [Tripterygium wilfordii]
MTQLGMASTPLRVSHFCTFSTLSSLWFSLATFVDTERMETLKRNSLYSWQEALQIAVRLEEKIYSAALSQQDYLRKISLKMLIWENMPQNTVPNPLESNSPSNSNKRGDEFGTLEDAGHLNIAKLSLNEPNLEY